VVRAVLAEMTAGYGPYSPIGRNGSINFHWLSVSCLRVTPASYWIQPPYVVRQRAPPVQDQLGRNIEVDLVGRADFGTENADAPGAADSLDVQVGLGDVDRVRLVALQTQQHGLGGAMAVAGGTEGAEQLRPNGGGLGEQAVLLQPGGEHPSGTHGADGVRAGRADADGEQVEDADCHAILRGIGGTCRKVTGTPLRKVGGYRPG
jgi:hypothetical protein